MHPVVGRHRRPKVILRSSRILAVLVAACATGVSTGAQAQPAAPSDSIARPTPNPAPGAAPASADTADPADVLVINAVGDVAYPASWGGGEYIDDKKHELFALTRPVLDTGDLNFANIECPLTEREPTVKKTYPITCKVYRWEYITRAGFNLLSLANNHSIDAGPAGIADTLELVSRTTSEAAPLYWAGVGNTPEEARRHVVFTPKGKRARVAFFAVANSWRNGIVASLHDPTLPDRIRAASSEAEIVIVSVHYGPEYIHVPPKTAVDKYHALVDAGADLVIAHHPHVIQGVERYKDGVIFYSLGNFSFGSRTRRHFLTGARLYSMIGRITVVRGQVDQVELVPLYANYRWNWTLGDETLEARHATPQMLTGPFAHFVLDELEDFTRRVPTASKTRLYRVGDRGFIDLGRGEPGDTERARLLHEQRHEYFAAAAAGAATRRATEAEKQVEGIGGTPAGLVRQAQEQAAREARGERSRKPGKNRKSKAGKRARRSAPKKSSRSPGSGKRRGR